MTLYGNNGFSAKYLSGYNEINTYNQSSISGSFDFDVLKPTYLIHQQVKWVNGSTSFTQNPFLRGTLQSRPNSNTLKQNPFLTKTPYRPKIVDYNQYKQQKGLSKWQKQKYGANLLYKLDESRKFQQQADQEIKKKWEREEYLEKLDDESDQEPNFRLNEKQKSKQINKQSSYLRDLYGGESEQYFDKEDFSRKNLSKQNQNNKNSYLSKKVEKYNQYIEQDQSLINKLTNIDKKASTGNQEIKTKMTPFYNQVEKEQKYDFKQTDSKWVGEADLNQTSKFNSGSKHLPESITYEGQIYQLLNIV